MPDRSSPTISGRRRLTPAAAAVAAALVLAASGNVFAGPPLLCHPFDIGTARSLPWDGSASWYHGRADYPLSALVADTEALLTPTTPVIVRMETLRRAAIYASLDAAVAARLMDRLTERAGAANTGTPDALALFDAAYMVEAFKQLSWLRGEFTGRAAAVGPLAAGKDGYAMVKKSLQLRPADPALEFAAALFAAGKDEAAYRAHAERARAGAGGDPLLARNIRQLG
ncbi:MAG TPA: hypothetical protein VK911_07785 [Vicinamibacterales bacterium]|nr:hypothetical protein [Vicinamibacterales bacterium]